MGTYLYIDLFVTHIFLIHITAVLVDHLLDLQEIIAVNMCALNKRAVAMKYRIERKVYTTFDGGEYSLSVDHNRRPKKFEILKISEPCRAGAGSILNFSL